MAAPTDTAPLLKSDKPALELPKTTLTEAEVKRELGLDLNQTAGSRSVLGRPSPREEAQLRAEGTYDGPSSGTPNAHHAHLPVEEIKTENGRRRSSIIDKLKHPFQRSRSGSPTTDARERKKSIADGGPFLVEQNPETGNWITRPNPHWPNDDSWKRENVRTGKGDSNVIVPGGEGGVSYY